MSDEEEAQPNPKETIARLIDIWIKRTGYKRQNLATLAKFEDYNLFYKAYLDMGRGLGKNADQALAVVQAVTTGLQAERRATLSEVLDFLKAIELPADRLHEIGPLFTRKEWAEVELAIFSISETDPDLLQRVRELEYALEQLKANAKNEEDILSEAQAHFAAMPEQLPAPGLLAQPYRMRLLRARLFTGRTTELGSMLELIRTQAPGETLAITGLGGIGKTSLVSEFVHRCGQFFRGGVFWLNCADPKAMHVEIAACGETGLVQHEHWDELDLEKQVELVLQAWQSALPRLLIFDSCEDEATLRRWRPSSGACRAILTSRQAHWPRNAAITLMLPVLSNQESVALLHSYRPDLSANTAAFASIAEELGRLPLALHLAGSYLESYQYDPQQGNPTYFLQTLQNPGPLAHAALQGIDVAMSPTDHDQHVSRSFALIMERLNTQESLDILAQSALARAAYFAPEAPFTVTMLIATLPSDAQGSAAVRRLLNLGLLSVDNQQLWIHRLIADFVRAALPDPQAKLAVQTALMRQSEQIYAKRDVQLARELLPHALIQTEYIEKTHLEQLVELYNNLPFLFDMVGDLHSGLRYLKQAHTALYQEEMVETALGAEVLNNLAEWHKALGNMEPVRQLHEQALTIRQALLPPDHLSIAESQLNLGSAFADEQSFDQARNALRKALLIAERSGGPQHDIALAARNHLALVLFGQERYEEAVQQFEELLEISAAAFGRDDPRTVTVHNNIASIYGRLGNYAGAIQEFNQVVASFTGRMGAEHPDTLKARLNAARARILGKIDCENACQELRTLLLLLESAFGSKHMIVEIARTTLEEC